MRFLAININYNLDQNWYHRCNSILECYQYFDRLGPGDGPRIAIYDTYSNQYLWIDEEHLNDEKRLNNIVFEAMKNIQVTT